jgi:hypothetical protein
MFWVNAKKLKDEDFKRLTGVKRSTFDKMIEILKEAEVLKKRFGGKPNKLVIEDRLLMTLEYLREYRTYFHVANNYGIRENTCYRNIIWVENVLVKSKEFSLPKKKELIDDNEIEVILVDATESPIERLKRNYKQKKFTQEKRRGTQ